MPWRKYDGIEFLEKGGFWMQKLHIFKYPFYYIDYCMAQTIAFEFYMLSLKNREEAFAKYLAFVDMAGTATFEDIVKNAGLVLPYEEGAIASIAGELDDYVKNVLAKNAQMRYNIVIRDFISRERFFVFARKERICLFGSCF